MIVRPPAFLTRALHMMTWNLRSDKKEVFLTFDDGPTPGVTPWVLDRLEEAGAKATFFLLGRNVDKHPELLDMIREAGHSVGNHTYSHLKGFSSGTTKYLEDIRLAGSLIDSKLFRPPYGRILPGQVRALLLHYDLIMWDVLSIDYNTRLSKERVLQNVVRNVKPGSIIVFHDSAKACKNLHYALPGTLSYLKEQGFTMSAIPSQGLTT